MMVIIFSLFLNYNCCNSKHDYFSTGIVPIIGKVDQHTQRGLLTCWWPGRCQIIPFGNFTFYLDGAHTTHSAIICARWFDSAAPRFGFWCYQILFKLLKSQENKIYNDFSMYLLSQEFKWIRQFCTALL